MSKDQEQELTSVSFEGVTNPTKPVSKKLRSLGALSRLTLVLLVTASCTSSKPSEQPLTIPYPATAHTEETAIPTAIVPIPTLTPVTVQKDTPTPTPVELPPLSDQEKRVQSIIEGVMKSYTSFIITIDGKEIETNMPYGEYTNPDFPHNTKIGGVPSKLSPEQARDNFDQAKRSGELEQLYRQNLAYYSKVPNPGILASLPSWEQILYAIPSPEERALSKALIDTGNYMDCNGTTYRVLEKAYNTLRPGSTFESYIKQTFPDLADKSTPAAWFNIERFADPRFSISLGRPAVTDLKPGDIIIPKENNNMFHVFMVEGINIQNSKTILELSDDNNETDPFGVKTYSLVITNDTKDKGLGWQQWLSPDSRISVSQLFAQRGDGKIVPENKTDTYGVFRPKVLLEAKK